MSDGLCDLGIIAFATGRAGVGDGVAVGVAAVVEVGLTCTGVAVGVGVAIGVGATFVTAAEGVAVAVGEATAVANAVGVAVGFLTEESGRCP